MISDDRFKKVASHESCGDMGDVGLKILVCLDRELTAKEKEEVSHAAYNIHRSLVIESVRQHPTEQRQAAGERQMLLALFEPHQPVFVEEIPNGYDSTSSRPWFVVTTRVGRIKIGWRKRVIVIDWSDSVWRSTAEEVFKDEDVTKDGRSIHAWGYAKAAEYLARILTV